MLQLEDFVLRVAVGQSMLSSMRMDSCGRGAMCLQIGLDFNIFIISHLFAISHYLSAIHAIAVQSACNLCEIHFSWPKASIP
jgi:hypothetical protein